MGSLLSTIEIIERVELMLDALLVPNLSAKEFADGCAALEVFLATHGDSLSQTEKLDDAARGRVVAVIARLDQLQKRATVKAAMPGELQKYIADNDDYPA
jgi:hypothetical protein